MCLPAQLETKNLILINYLFISLLNFNHHYYDNLCLS